MEIRSQKQFRGIVGTTVYVATLRGVAAIRVNRLEFSALNRRVNIIRFSPAKHSPGSKAFWEHNLGFLKGLELVVWNYFTTRKEAQLRTDEMKEQREALKKASTHPIFAG